MTREKKEKLLTAHGIAYTTDGGQLVAVETGTHNGTPYTEKTDVTDWDAATFWGWLGYSAPGVW